MKTSIFWFCLILCLAFTISACSENGETQTATRQAVDLLDRAEPPTEYAALSNPLADDPDASLKGQELFTRNCTACHGETGAGDGPAGAGLNPPPQDLAANENAFSDAYLYWRIAEGGWMEPFNSAMPAWKTALSEQEIWQLVTYIRQLAE